MAKKKDPSSISRRRVLKGAGAGAAAVAFPIVLTPRKSEAAVIKLTARDPGGPYVKAYGAAYYEPFNKKFAGKIEVTGVIGKHEPTSQIKAMVDTSTYTWDVALLSEAARAIYDVPIREAYPSLARLATAAHVYANEPAQTSQTQGPRVEQLTQFGSLQVASMHELRLVSSQ